jgi:hypothetical protein
MINFEEEIKKFEPCLEIEEAEQAIYAYDTKDVSDILNEMIKEIKKENK